MFPVVNTFTEVEQTINTLLNEGFYPSELKFLIFVDQWHAQRAHAIWRALLPANTEIEVRPVACLWTNKQAQVLQRNPRLWRLVNWIAYVLTRMFGVGLLGRLKQPS